MIKSRVNVTRSYFLPALRLAVLAASCWAGAAFAAERAASIEPPAELLGKPSEASSTSPSAALPAEPLAKEKPVPSAPARVAPVELGKPVASKPLEAINPDTLGLLSQAEGGFGAAMWEGTPRGLVDKLLPEIDLPANSPTLNSLARRLLLSTAAVPTGEGSQQTNLTSLRLERLLALGDVTEAWQLALMAKPDRVNAMTMRLVTEASLIGPDSKAHCDRLPELMAGQNNEEWQKALAMCQLRAGDTKAMQLSLDVMREQNVRDDIFILLANRALSGEGKRLPRQLTPLRPLTLGLLREIDLPLPPEIYARPDAVLIPELLKTKSEDDRNRLMLAEKAASRGIIGGAQLADAYRSVVYPPEVVDDAAHSGEKGARMHALLFQAAEKEQVPAKRISLIAQFVQASEAGLLDGAGGQALAELAATVPVTADGGAVSATMARLFALAGKPDKALEWMKHAVGVAGNNVNVAAELRASWPLFVLSGMISDGEYAKGMKAWLETMVNDPALDSSAARASRQQAGNILTLFDAAGFVVPEEAWLSVIDGESDNKRMALPSPVLLERLRSAGAANRRGEAVLLSILMMGGDDATPPFVTAEAVRALRLVGLKADALALAREAVMGNV